VNDAATYTSTVGIAWAMAERIQIVIDPAEEELFRSAAARERSTASSLPARAGSLPDRRP
jgi:hypothetical protein